MISVLANSIIVVRPEHLNQLMLKVAKRRLANLMIFLMEQMSITIHAPYLNEVHAIF